MEDADDFAWFYHVKVTDTLRGGEKDELAVYGNSKLIEAGKQYCLFLYENDFEFWPMPLTLLVDRDSVFEIYGDNVHAPERYKLSGAKGAFMSAISSLPASSCREVRSVTERIDRTELSRTAHYKRLVSLGLEGDISFCLTRDLTDIVPEYKNGVIEL